MKARALLAAALVLSLMTAVTVGLNLGRSTTEAAILSRAGIGLGLATCFFVLLRHRPLNWLVGLGPTVVALLMLVVEQTGGVGKSPVHPLIYVWLAIIAPLASERIALLTGATALLSELLLFSMGPPGGLPAASLIAHAGFMILFASLSAGLLAREVQRARAARSYCWTRSAVSSRTAFG